MFIFDEHDTTRNDTTQRDMTRHEYSYKKTSERQISLTVIGGQKFERVRLSESSEITQHFQKYFTDCDRRTRALQEQVCEAIGGYRTT